MPEDRNKYPTIPEAQVNAAVESRAVIATAITRLTGQPTLFPPDQTHEWEMVDYDASTKHALWRVKVDENDVPLQRQRPVESQKEEKEKGQEDR